MSTATHAYIATHHLGRLEQSLPIGGKATSPAGSSVRPELCLTTSSLFLVIAATDGDGEAIDLTKAPSLRYEPGRFGDSLEIGDKRFTIPRQRARHARRMLGIGRLRVHSKKGARGPWLAPQVEALSPLEHAWLSAELGPDELLFAWVHGSSSTFVASPLQDNARGQVSLVVTDQRCCLVAITALGDAASEALGSAGLRFTSSRGSVSLESANWRFVSRRGNRSLARSVALACAMTPAERFMAFARECYRAADSEPGRHRLAERALARADDAGHAMASLTLTMCYPKVAPALSPEAMARLQRTSTPATALADLWEDWGIGLTEGMDLLARLQELDKSEPWALELHRRLHRAQRPVRSSDATESDLHLARHLIQVGQHREARLLLEERLRHLPGPDVADLLPPDPTPHPKGRDAKAQRIRLRELLAETEKTTDVDTLAELAKLQPLMPERLSALAHAADGNLRTRAASAAALLEPAGLMGDAVTRASLRRDAPLTLPEISTRLPHPLARGSGPFVAKLQALLASAPHPEHNTLKAYCEKLDPESHPKAAEALRDAREILGIPRIEAYISRGDKSVGVRAYEASPPFILIGGKHLTDGDFRMSASELRFALGAELAHLRLGHTPVTSSELWAGALEKTREGFDLALTFLPLLKGYKLAKPMSRVLSVLPSSTARRIAGGAETLRQLFGQRDTPLPDEGALSRTHEELLAAHRIMQLTADRAGLVVSADLQAALRAMLLLRQDHKRLLDRSLSEGLSGLLAEKNESGELAHQDLAVRVAALIAFYLSEDYAALCRVAA